jgi:(2Fe-2S) ferredoxin
MSKLEFPNKSIYVCTGSKCGKYKEIRKYLKESINVNGLKKSVEIFKIECSDRCKYAPIVCVQPENQWYSETSYRDVDEIVANLSQKSHT